MTDIQRYDLVWFYKSLRKSKRVIIQDGKTPSDCNGMFSDIDFGQPKHLECRVHDYIFTIAENVSIPYRIPMTEPDYENLKVDIVYFANTNVNRLHGSKLIIQNLKEFLNCQILQNLPKSHVHLVLSIHFSDVQDEIGQIIPIQMYDRFTFHVNYENEHEYPGILKVHELGKTSDIVLYFHSKNMTRYYGQRNFREFVGDKIMHDIVKNWKYCLFILHNFPSIDKVVETCSQEGWGWYNYWWARGSYLQDMRKPRKTSDRYYYESWLGREYVGVKDKIKNTWSVCTTPTKGFYNVGTTYRWYEAIDQRNSKIFQR